MNTRDRITEYVSKLQPGSIERVSYDWYMEAGRNGLLCSWPRMDRPDVFLATRAKGIYKPSWSEYPLSVRTTLNSGYADDFSMNESEASWNLIYHCEGESPKDSFVNRALLKALKDKVPLGYLRQVKEKKYLVLGLGLVVEQVNASFVIQGATDL